MNKLDGQSMDLVKENVEKLKELFPSIVKEDKIDFEELELLLGENINRNKEQYSFTWNGKTESTKLAQKRSTGTLRPCIEESKDWDTTQNLYIEGDNLEVLRLLQASYNGRIKMIYIDPPYNTGHDFVYKDNFEDNIKNYKEQTGQAQKSNADTDGRYHTNWLNMMYPRLKLARNLLTDDGVIFISIDDNEQANLKKICDEIFGENNNVSVFVWNTKKAAQGMTTATMIVNNYESILVYAKNINNFKFRGLDRDQNNGFSNPDNDDRGPWKRQYLQRLGQGLPRRTLIDPTTGQKFTFETPYTQEKLNRWIKENRIIFPSDPSKYPARKEFLHEYENKQQLISSLGLFPTKTTTEKLYNIFNNEKIFTNPKPDNLIKFLINQGTYKDDIVLDFFSGSATTAHAVMQLNAEDGGNRRFIMVQLPELTDENSEAYKAGYKNICEIGKERIHRVGEKIKNIEGLDGMIIAHRLTGKDKLSEKDMEELKKSQIYQRFKNNLDTGFKVFKLDSSNLKKWDNTPTKDVDVIQDRIQTSMDYIKEDRTELDLVYEVMLKYGIDLSLPITKTQNEKAYIVEAPEYKLLVCTYPNLTIEDIEDFANESVETYLFADLCFNTDNLLVNTEEILKSCNKEMRLF